MCCICRPDAVISRKVQKLSADELFATSPLETTIPKDTSSVLSFTLELLARNQGCIPIKNGGICCGCSAQVMSGNLVVG